MEQQDPKKTDKKKTETKITTEIELGTAPLSGETTEVPVEPSHPKRHFGAVVVGIIIGLVAVVFAAIVIWFFACYNTPERAAYDAVENAIKSKNIVSNGNIVVWTGDRDISKITISLNSSSTNLPNSTSVIMTFETSDSRSFTLQLGTAIMQDGVIYLQIGGIMDALKTAGVDRRTQNEFEVIFDTLDLIDNEWWRISVPEVLSALEFNKAQADGISEIYTCAVNTLAGDNSGEIAKLYSSHRFIQVTPVDETLAASAESAYRPAAWYDLYEVSFNKNALADFINALPETAAATSFYNCYNNVMVDDSDKISSSDFDEISADEIDIPENLHIYLEISRLDHELRSLHLYSKDGDYEMSGAVLFDYREVTVSAPTNYRPITELVDELIEIFVELMPMPLGFEDSSSAASTTVTPGDIIWAI